MADPADSNLFVVSIGGALSVNFDQAEQFLDQVGLLERVVLDKRFWQKLDGVIAIPWQSRDKND